MDYTTSEITVQAPGRNIIRKKFPKILDVNMQENKQLVQVPYNPSNRFLTAADVEKIFKLVVNLDMTSLKEQEMLVRPIQLGLVLNVLRMNVKFHLQNCLNKLVEAYLSFKTNKPLNATFNNQYYPVPRPLGTGLIFACIASITITSALVGLRHAIAFKNLRSHSSKPVLCKSLAIDISGTLGDCNHLIKRLQSPQVTRP